MLSTSFHVVNAYYHAKQPISSIHVIYTSIQKKNTIIYPSTRSVSPMVARTKVTEAAGRH